MRIQKIKIISIKQLTPDVKSFTCSKPEGYTFGSGQVAMLSINKEGWRDKKRPFTFTSLPKDETLELIIKAYPEHNGVTQQIHQLQVGDEFMIGDPWGSMHYKGPGVFIAGGAGITPFLPMLRKLHEERKVPGHKLIYSNKTFKDIILGEEIKEIFKNNPDDLFFVLTREKHEGCLSGRIDQEFLEKNINDFKQNFYLCGPPPFMSSMQKYLKNLGAKPQVLIFES